MRLLTEIPDVEQGEALSLLLTENGVKNEAEVYKNNDWGSDDYGNFSCRIWILEEERVEQAEALLHKFGENPSLYLSKLSKAPLEETSQLTTPTSKTPLEQVISLWLIALCIVIFFLTESTVPPHPDRIVDPIGAIPLTSSPLKRMLLFDWPLTYQRIDQVIDKFGPQVFEDPNTLPPEGKALYQEAVTTPFFEGFYPIGVALGQGKSLPPSAKADTFTKIRQGQYWRLFSPALLHYDLFHLFFNMIWLAFLGRQIESKIGPWRYILFILIAGVFTNCCQYLMSGPNFLGYSGVLAAYFGFIWMRQHKAPYEGYQVPGSIFTFIGVFIFGLAALQTLSFFAEIFYGSSISPGIANTAHISGALLGLLLGRLSLFSWKH